MWQKVRCFFGFHGDKRKVVSSIRLGNMVTYLAKCKKCKRKFIL